MRPASIQTGLVVRGCKPASPAELTGGGNAAPGLISYCSRCLRLRKTGCPGNDQASQDLRRIARCGFAPTLTPRRGSRTPVYHTFNLPESTAHAPTFSCFPAHFPGLPTLEPAPHKRFTEFPVFLPLIYIRTFEGSERWCVYMYRKEGKYIKKNTSSPCAARAPAFSWSPGKRQENQEIIGGPAAGTKRLGGSADRPGYLEESPICS